ncbi:hypothetical protein DSECCO2_500940 [anaerobic digester metagenome]
MDPARAPHHEEDQRHARRRYGVRQDDGGKEEVCKIPGPHRPCILQPEEEKEDKGYEYSGEGVRDRCSTHADLLVCGDEQEPGEQPDPFVLKEGIPEEVDDHREDDDLCQAHGEHRCEAVVQPGKERGPGNLQVEERHVGVPVTPRYGGEVQDLQYEHPVPPGIRTEYARDDKDLRPYDRYAEEDDLRQDPAGLSPVRQEDLEGYDAGHER